MWSRSLEAFAALDRSSLARYASREGVSAESARTRSASPSGRAVTQLGTGGWLAPRRQRTNGRPTSFCSGPVRLSFLRKATTLTPRTFRHPTTGLHRSRDVDAGVRCPPWSPSVASGVQGEAKSGACSLYTQRSSGGATIESVARCHMQLRHIAYDIIRCDIYVLFIRSGVIPCLTPPAWLTQPAPALYVPAPAVNILMGYSANMRSRIEKEMQGQAVTRNCALLHVSFVYLCCTTCQNEQLPTRPTPRIVMHFTK